MNLAGKLNNETLKSIFQYMLQQNLSGSISISDGSSERLLFIQPQALKLFSIGERKRIKMGEVLMLMGAITKDQLREAIYLQKNTGMKMGAVLKEKGALDDATLDKAVQNVIFEEVYDLLFWEGASFYYMEQTVDTIFDRQDLRFIEAVIDVKEFLTEVTAKIDEIEILLQWIPDTSVIYELKKNIKPEDCQAKIPGYSCRLIVDLLNGENDIEQVCEEAKISRYEIFRVVSLLLSDGYIQESQPESLVVRADEYLSQDKGSEALRLYRFYISRGGDRNAVLKKIAQAEEKAGESQLAAVDYAEYAELCYSNENYAEAFQIFENVTRLWPDNTDFIIHYGELLNDQGRTVEWAVQLEKAARLFEKDGNTEKAIELYRAVLKVSKNSPRSQRQLAKLMRDRLSTEEQASNILCPVCETLNARDQEECSQCGQRLYHSCLSCSKSIPVSDSVCVECGGDPHKSADDSRGGIFDEEDGVPGGPRESGTFWNTKLDIYAAKAKESRAKLDFGEAITSLETAMLINPDSPRLQEEMDAVQGMVRKQELAGYIEQGMIGYYRKNWKQAFDGYKRVIRMIDDSHPMYSDIATYYREAKQHAKKKLMISVVVLVIVLLAGAASYAPIALEQRTRRRAREALKALESETMGKEPLVFREAFTKAAALREEYKEHPQLTQQADAVRNRLRTVYLDMARDDFDAAVGLRASRKWEEAIAGLKNVQATFPDIEAKELACMGEIPDRISEFEGRILARDDLSARQAVTRGYLDDLEKELTSGQYLAARKKEVLIDKQLAWNAAVLTEPETARFKAGAAKIGGMMDRVEAATRQIRALTVVGRFEEAESRISQSVRTFRKTDLIARFKELEQANQKADTDTKARYDKAKNLRKRGKFEDALEELAALKKQYPEMSGIRNIEQIEKDIRGYIAEGHSRLKRIDGLLRAGRTEAAYQLTQSTLREYDLLPEVKMLRIPVLIQTKPGTVLVSSGKEEKGETPLTVMLRPGSSKELKFTKRGFLSTTVAVNAASWNLMVALEKTTLWPPVDLKGKVKARPVIKGDLVIIPVGAGLRAYDSRTGKISWEVTLYATKKVKPVFDGKGGEVFVGRNEFWDLTAAPFLYGEDVIMGGRDGKIYYVNPRTGAIKKVLPDRMSKQGYGGIAGGVFVKRIPILRNEEVAFFGNLDKHLYAVPIQDGKVRWRTAFKTDNFTSAYVNEKGVWIGTGDGKLSLCSFLNGMVVTDQQIGFLPLFDPVTADDRVLAASRSGHVTMLKKDFSLLWERNLEEPLTGPPVVLADMVYCPGRKRICIALQASDGKTVWGPSIGAAASSSPLKAGSKVFVGSDDKFLYCLNAVDGSVAWKYEIGGQARYLRVKGDTLIVVTDDGKIYTFVIEI